MTVDWKRFKGWTLCVLKHLLAASIAISAVSAKPGNQRTQLFAQNQEKQPTPKQLEARTRLVAGFAAESVMQSIENLPNFDDTVSTMGVMQLTNDPLPEESYRFERIYVPRLNRVRKIISQATGEQRSGVVARLKD